MTDITTKLRSGFEFRGMNGEAADEIDRLRAEVAELRDEVAQLCGYDNAKEMDAHRAADASRVILTEAT